MSLIDSKLLSSLDGLKIITHRPLPGRFKGDLRSPKKGSAIEFADFRDYVPGDDLRTIDWNIYARLERPYIKLFEEEEDTTIRILIDCSRSMRWGEPDKLNYARKLGGCLSYIALRNLNWVSVYGFSDGVNARFALHRGLAYIPPLLNFLEGLEPTGKTNLLGACRQIVSERSAAGLVFIISDLFGDNIDKALSLLGERKREVCVIHILSPQELEPDVLGDIRLVDSETGEKREASITPKLLNKYKKNLRTWKESLESACHKRGMNYIDIETSIPLDELLLKTFRKRGLLT